MKRIAIVFLLSIFSVGIISCSAQKEPTIQSNASITLHEETEKTMGNDTQNSAANTSVANESTPSQVYQTTTQTESNITKSTKENPDEQSGFDGQEYVGLEYTNLPKGITEHEGEVLEGDYCLTYVFEGKNQMVWLEKAFYNNEGKVQHYKVLDVIVSPEKNEKYTFALQGNYINDEYAPDIITLVERTTDDYWSISYAWRVNLKKEQIGQIEIKGLKCENTTFSD